MSERGETDSRSIGSSDKFHATAVRMSVVNQQTRGMLAQRRQFDMFTKGRIVEMLESSRSQTEVSRSECGPVCDIKTVAKASKSGKCYPTTSIRSTKSHNSSTRPISGAVGPDFIFMDDNASCHRAMLIDDILESVNIQRMSWPANSPDWNPIDCQVIYSQFGLAIQELKPNDHQARRRFVEWAQNEIAVVPDFHKRILFSDEAHFWLNGYVNKQNCRIWSEANPQVYVETPLHPEKLTVWCALWAGGVPFQKR
ncbi:transposable element Tcb2 transposase [Trichonephila clavipes]|nr:transposable element Tcb2 transposase [Trichonephila clavipes]